MGTEYVPGNIFTWLVNALFGTDFITDKIILPVGISFFTFQTISYAVDVYQDKIKPVKSILDFGFYVSFFPQLVAGPIVRAADFIPQIYQPYRLTRAEFGLATFWILQGLIKKVFLADYIAVNFVDRVFDNPMLFTGFENLLSLYGYSLQVYADFSGYTDIAIGVSLLMGFRLNTNFNSPYKSENVGEFWRRWHISLSSWLRDYLYIPMGGSKGASVMTIIFLPIVAGLLIFYIGPDAVVPVVLSLIIGVFIFMWVTYYHPKVRQVFTTNINLALTMLLGGLWHGSSWLFVIWGGLNGAGLVVYKMGAAIARWTKEVAWGYRLGVIFFGIFLTVALVALFKMGGMSWEGLGIFAGWIAISLFGLIIYLILRPWVEGKAWWAILARIWGVFLTFHFISYTRIWFRQSSLDGTSRMLHQIYYNFSLDLAPKVLLAYAPVFLVIYLGMVIHWLPTWMKDGYRNLFIKMPLFLQILIVAVVVFLLFQVMSSDTQAFIYFQF
jgi:D-alanyl-lipoteichoic acid acyltransferase DltB (MBOAT superfamily)